MARPEPIVIDGDRMYLAGMMEEGPDLYGMTKEGGDAFVGKMRVARQEIRDGAPWITDVEGEDSEDEE